jgi:hypothetical protein
LISRGSQKLLGDSPPDRILSRCSASIDSLITGFPAPLDRRDEAPGRLENAVDQGLAYDALLAEEDESRAGFEAITDSKGD